MADSLASEPTYPTISVAELRTLLTLATKATIPVADALELANLFERGVTLANQSHPIGAVVPVSRPETDPSGEAPIPPAAV